MGLLPTVPNCKCTHAGIKSCLTPSCSQGFAFFDPSLRRSILMVSSCAPHFSFVLEKSTMSDWAPKTSTVQALTCGGSLEMTMWSFHRVSFFLQDPEKEVSDWLSDLTLVDQHPDLEVHFFLLLFLYLPQLPDIKSFLHHLYIWIYPCKRVPIQSPNICFLSVSQGLPEPQTVSSSIQQMWALTEVMQSNQTTASIGRFDVSSLSLSLL